MATETLASDMGSRVQGTWGQISLLGGTLDKLFDFCELRFAYIYIRHVLNEKEGKMRQ